MRLVLLCLILLPAACARSAGGPGPELILSVRPERPAPGDSVQLTLSNGTDASVGHNLCTSSLERQVGPEWEAVRSDRVCTMEIRGLTACEEARFTLALPPDLPPATYRFTTAVEAGGGADRRAVASEPFRVGT